MGATHVAAYQKAAAEGAACELVAAADPKASRRAGRLDDVGGNIMSSQAAFDASVVRGYETAEELVADDRVNLVSICTPTNTHIDVAELAIRAGKHVLIEKPVDLSVERIRLLARFADEHGVRCMPAMCMRFWPGWSSLALAHAQRQFGELLSIRFTRLGTRPIWSAAYRDDALTGGALVDLHIHDTDFICHLLGVPAAVTSTGSVSHLTTHYHYADIPHVTAEGGWDQHDGFPFKMQYVATFERATLDFDIGRQQQLLVCRDGKAEVAPLEQATGYDCEIRYFIQVLKSGDPLEVTLEDAAMTQTVLDAERRSLESGKRIDIAL